MSNPMDALQAILQPARLKNTLFPPNSRYAGIDTATLEAVAPSAARPAAATMSLDPSQAVETIVYLRRRFVPDEDQFALLQPYTVIEGDRPDLIAARFMGDPELSWRLCDANGVMRPEELTATPGRTLRITLPQGIPGVANA